MLAPELHLLELAQSTKPHIEDGLGLNLGELESAHQRGLWLVLLADDFDDLVDVEIDNEIAVEHLEPVVDLGQAEFGAADENDLAVVEPFAQHLAQAQHVRHLAAAQHVHVERHARLELGQLEHLLHEKDRIDGAALRLEHEPHLLGRLVADVGKQRQLLLQEQLGNAGDEARLRNLIGDLGDHDLIGAAAGVLGVPARAQTEAAAPGLVGLHDLLARLDDDAAGRQIGPGHEVDQLVGGGVGELDQMQRRIAELARIVRRDIGRHADGDARGAIGEQVGEIGRQHRRLLLAPVVVGAEIDGVLVDAVEQPGRDLGEARLGVALGGGVVAVDIAEIALAVDKRIADGEVLGETGERVVDRLVTVGVEVAHGVADDLGAFPEFALGAEPELLHGVEQPPMHRLQPIAHVGQRPVHDGGERISEVALLERLAQFHGLDRPLRIRRRCYAASHDPRLAHRRGPLKGAVRDFGRGEKEAHPHRPRWTRPWRL